MRNFLLLLFITSLISCKQKTTFNTDLKQELSEILKKDQGFRELSSIGISEDRKKELLTFFNLSEEYFLENERKLFKQNDSLNLIQIEKIIEKHGYPGKSMVGEPEDKTAWLVIQHSDKIAKYFPIIKKAGKEGELSKVNVAIMEDRMLMNAGKEQIYGSQGKAIFLVENPSKQEDMMFVIWPIKNPEKVNKLRKEVGFENSIEEYAKQLEIEYKVYSIDEVNEMNKVKY